MDIHVTTQDWDQDEENLSTIENNNTFVPNDNTSSDELNWWWSVYPKFSFFVNVPLIGSICIVGIICNIISVCMFFRRVARTSMTYQLQWLGVVDALFLAFCFDHYSLHQALKDLFHDPKEFPTLVGELAYCGKHAAHTATVWLTVFIGINRYLAVCRPLSSRHAHVKKYGERYVTLVLVLSVLYNVPYFVVRYATYPHALHTPMYRTGYVKVLRAVFMFGVPLLILVVLTSNILIVLWKRRHMQNSMTAQGSQNSTTAMLTAILVIFILCQLPMAVFWVLFVDPSVIVFYLDIAQLFEVINSAVNGFVYCIMNRRFRAAFRCARNNNNESIQLQMSSFN